MKRRIAKLLIAVGVLLLLVVLALIALPIWFPWVARPLAAKTGLRYVSYERNGYSSFTLRNATFDAGSIAFKADRIDGLTPMTWLWSLQRGRDRSPYLRVKNWTLRISGEARVSANGQPERKAPVSTQREISWTDYPTIVSRWLPAADFANGTVQTGKTKVRVPVLSWRRGQIDGLAATEGPPAVSADFRISAAALPYTVRAEVKPFGISSELTISTNAAGFSASGSAAWQSNCIYLQAQFPRSGLVPDSALLTGTNVIIPETLLRIPGYKEARTDIEARWTQGGFIVQAKSSAAPLQPELPPLSADLQVVGSTNYAVIRTARISAPGLLAQLTHDVSLIPKPPWLLEPAQLLVEIDFGQAPLAPVAGKAQANVFLAPVANSAPSVRFFLTASDVFHRELTIKKMDSEGSLIWPELRIDRLRAQLGPDFSAHISGSCNLSNRVINGGSFVVSSKAPPPLLPDTIDFTSLSITGSVSGPFAAPNHKGQLEARSVTIRKSGARSSQENPGTGTISLPQVSMEWQGRSLDFPRVALRAKCMTNELSLNGAVSITTNLIRARLDQLAFSSNSVPMLSLEKPAEAALAIGTQWRQWSVSATEWALSGTAGELRIKGNVDWPSSGQAQISGTGLNTTMMREFVPLQEFTIDTFSASGAWSNGPVTFALNVAVRGTGTNFPFTLEARVSGDGNGAILQQAAIASSNIPLVVASGRVPVRLHPGSANLLDIDPSGPVNLNATAQPDPFLWDYLARATGWKVNDPDLKARISGTWRAPQAQVQLTAAQVLPPDTVKSIPALGPLRMVVNVEPGRALIEPFEIKVQGQDVSAAAEIPLKHLPYRNFRDFADWSGLSARIRVPGASIAAFEPLAPKVVAPEGRIEMDLTLQPGFKLDGRLLVSGARTVPIGTLGPVRDINVRMRFENDEAFLEAGRARIGGVPVSVSGQAKVAATNLSASTFRLTAKGSKVPISRQPQAILRGDVDVVILKTNQAQPLITGTVRMRDSFYLSDLSALVPGKVVDPKERPPYFSITDKPIADWRLDVQVSGDRGLRFRTPVVAGEVSPNARLGGTLQNPVAVGDVRVDSGSVRFPFGNLEIQQGLITVTTQDPAHPQISLNAASRQYGYDIRLSVSGTVDSLVLEFSSTPPLSSDQILMMLTAGELPRGAGALTAQQRAQSFAMFIGRDLLSKLGMGDQAGDRLVVRSGEEFSDEGRPTYDVEYKLNKRWSVTGEYDRFGDFNAGLKWRVFSR